MATGRARPTRKLRPWLVQQVESGKYPGLVWDDDKKTSFRIPWKHAGKQDFRHDEDAAIFKAWAIFKNKFHSGDKVDAASWKTRLRCALNKSPEFQELPNKSHLDISEPYKVYRIVPIEDQCIPGSGRTARKRKGAAELRNSSSDEEEEEQKQKRPNLIKLELPCLNDVSVTSSASLEDSGIGSDSSSTETHSLTQHNPEPSIPVPVISSAQMSNTDLQVIIYYSGVEVYRCRVQSGECKISAAIPLVHASGTMEHVPLPAPDGFVEGETCTKTQKLLSFLQSGIMLASNPQGIFAQRQRSCQGRIFWTGPCIQQSGESNKLDRHTFVKLFDTHKFFNELETYRAGGGPPPDYHVILCFGEEISNTDTFSEKLITAQLEQIMASELVHEASQSHCNSQSLDQLLQDPPAPYRNPLPPLDTLVGTHGVYM
ncbi:interferon regulatory factor 9 isoform 1-T1 [Discoglossus pictus]